MKNLTAKSELFVEEEVRDIVEQILKQRGILGENDCIRVECPSDWSGIWDVSNFPEGGKARILDEETDEVIGEVEWDTDFKIESDIGGRYIDAEPKITRLVWKGRNVALDSEGEKPLKVFKVSAEELGYETVKCGGCLWRTSAFYVLAESKEEALELIQKGEAGLCGDCFGELLADLSEKGYEFVKNIK